MKIEVSNTEKSMFIYSAYINLNYWIYEADAREYYNEILGTLIILCKLDENDFAEQYKKDFYKLIKSSNDILKEFYIAFPDFKEV